MANVMTNDRWVVLRLKGSWATGDAEFALFWGRNIAEALNAGRDAGFTREGFLIMAPPAAKVLVYSPDEVAAHVDRVLSYPPGTGTGQWKATTKQDTPSWIGQTT